MLVFQGDRVLDVEVSKALAFYPNTTPFIAASVETQCIDGESIRCSAAALHICKNRNQFGQYPRYIMHTGGDSHGELTPSPWGGQTGKLSNASARNWRFA